jgi:outer membrane protein assembly factor BamB
MRVFTLTAMVSAFALSMVGEAADWPQWRGPQRNALSPETGLLREWPQGGPALLWQRNDIGDGYSSVAVVGPRLYTLGNDGLENEFVHAMSVQEGKTVWRTRLGNVGNPDQAPSYPKARSTPTVDGAFVYALSSDGDLVSIESASGKVRWQKSLRKDFAGQPGTWAYAESPLVDGDVVVVTPGGAEATMVALNKISGAVVWKSAIPGGDPAGYASAVVLAGAGPRQYVQFTGKGVVGVDAKTGTFLWRYDEASKGPANMPTPVASGAHVYSSAGNVGGALIRLATAGETVTASQVYLERGLPNTSGGSVLVGPTLFGTTREGLVAADYQSGKVLWQSAGIGPGSIIAADGLLFIHGENGDVALVEAAADGYREKGRVTPSGQPEHMNREKAWSYPTVANGRLYVRDRGTLWSFNVAAAGR